jgi:SAM-dependent methyltransferase
MTSLFKATHQAKNYASYRPTYPSTVYAKILSSIQHCKHDDGNNKTDAKLLAIDVGCGTGQATVALAEHFDQVIGIDPSEAQLQHATSHSRVSYQVGQETCLPAADGTVAAVTSSQAAHWFDISKFYQEVDRVLKPGGCLALWMYGNFEIHGDDELQTMIVDSFYEDLLGKGGYWDDRRRLVENRYRDIPLLSDINDNYLGERINTGYDIQRTFATNELIGYLRSWSAYVTYCKENSIQECSDEDPLKHIQEYLESKSQHQEDGINVTFPVTMLLCVKKT